MRYFGAKLVPCGTSCEGEKAPCPRPRRQTHVVFWCQAGATWHLFREGGEGVKIRVLGTKHMRYFGAKLVPCGTNGCGREGVDVTYIM